MTGEDMSGSKVPPAEQMRITGELYEERERRIWKTRVIRFVATMVIVFYGLFVFFLFKFTFYVTTVSLYLLVLLAAIPTFALMNLMKLVARSPDKGAGDPDTHPWVAIAKEAVGIFRDWAAKH